MKTKRCSGCDRKKLLSEFHRNCKSKDGRKSRCKVCCALGTVKRPKERPSLKDQAIIIEMFRQCTEELLKRLHLEMKRYDNRIDNLQTRMEKLEQEWRTQDPGPYVSKNAIEERKCQE